MLRKITLTGAACSGKSTIIKELENRGESVIEESAREIILARKDMPLTQDELLTRQYMVAAKQLINERAYEKINTSGKLFNLFLDRSMIDVAAYCKFLLGYVPEEIENSVKFAKYSTVFILERLPFEKDCARFENGEEERSKIEELLRETYISYNHYPVTVPVMSINERTDFILNYSKKFDFIYCGVTD